MTDAEISAPTELSGKKKRKRNRKSELPKSPFLCLAPCKPLTTVVTLVSPVTEGRKKANSKVSGLVDHFSLVIDDFDSIQQRSTGRRNGKRWRKRGMGL